MKKKILIVVGIIVALIIVVFGYFIVSDLKQEDKLITELNEISDLVNEENVDIDEVNERLNNTVTKGDYKIVEESSKQYLLDVFNNIINITNILEDERITNSLSVTNYKEDGPDFLNTKEYLNNTITELKTLKDEYSSYLTEEKIMSYINDKNLDDYYVNLYKDEIVGDLNNTDKTVENSINEVITMLDKSENIIDFLIENKNHWEIENDNIIFDDTDLSREYDDLISQL